MKSFNTAFLLLAAATLTIGSASAQTVPNPKPAVQGRLMPVLREPVPNFQISATSRGAAIDNVSYVNQQGLGNFGAVVQFGTQQKADMIQVNTSATARGNDGYQTQNNGLGTIGRNDAYMVQVGARNYADQTQSGNLNVAIAEQGAMGVGGARNENYSVQCQTGSNNYGYVDQDSNKNFAHQNQTSSIGTSVGGGQGPSNATNGNWADTRQGNGIGPVGANGSDGQWSQVVQNGQNNRASVRQDHN
jgi:minor curlin subunit